jgi:hypothetical protein
MAKNPPTVRRSVHVRRRRDTNDLHSVLSSLLSNKIISAGGGKPTNIAKFREIVGKIIVDDKYWETIQELIVLAKKLNTSLNLY